MSWLGHLLKLDEETPAKKVHVEYLCQMKKNCGKKKNLLDWHNQKGFLIPKYSWRSKAPAISESLKWWQKAQEDINSAHDVEYNGHSEEGKWEKTYNHIPLVWASIHCELKTGKKLKAGEIWW